MSGRPPPRAASSPSQAGGPRLEVRELEVSYGLRPALRGLSLTVNAGEVVGLIGPNGCGKTTLIRAVSRLVPWQRGEILLDGLPGAGLSRAALARRVAVVPQKPVLPVGYTGLEAVLMGRTAHLGFLEQEGPRDLARCREALRQVDAEALAHCRVDELSGGEQQRIVLARALAQDAPLLLVDEPTANLDLGHQLAAFTLLRRLAREEGKAILAALHDLILAALHCHRLVLMADGRVLAEGLPREVLTEEIIRRAYGLRARVLRPAGLHSPLVLPLSAPAGGEPQALGEAQGAEPQALGEAGEGEPSAAGEPSAEP